MIWMSLSVLSKKALKSNSEGDGSNFKITTDKTVKDYLKYYLSLEQRRGGTRTRESYYFAAGKICDEIGEIKLGNVNPELIMDILNAYKKAINSKFVFPMLMLKM